MCRWVPECRSDRRRGIVEKGTGRWARESARGDRRGDRHADRQRVTDGETEEKRWQEKSEKEKKTNGAVGKQPQGKRRLVGRGLQGQAGQTGSGQYPLIEPGAVRPASQGSDAAPASLPPRCLVVRAQAFPPARSREGGKSSGAADRSLAGLEGPYRLPRLPS